MAEVRRTGGRLRGAMWRTLGIVLCVVGFLILLLPGPLGWPGIPPLLIGGALILRSSIGAKRWFLSAARQEPKTFGRARAWFRSQTAKRWRKRTGG